MENRKPENSYDCMIYDPPCTYNCLLCLIRLCGIKELNLEATPYAVVILKLDP